MILLHPSCFFSFEHFPPSIRRPCHNELARRWRGLTVVSPVVSPVTRCRPDSGVELKLSPSAFSSRLRVALIPFVSPQIRLYARPDAIASGAGDYALHITRRLLGFYQDYFNVQYSLPKLGKNSRPRPHWPPLSMTIFGVPSHFHAAC